ncbi:Oxidoreductase, molybdopterin-binding domain-containing protein [Podospora didyma]|uniref:Nitrate reductase [NADPH] n=1 Tax=Podospora didyma TaxID=330526 RepID=A0AAE0NPQ2_9PEZI|nr:Oxidoreductase, molybdopterin-binding domain-containing protein [Podospora didyma]
MASYAPKRLATDILLSACRRRAAAVPTGSCRKLRPRSLCTSTPCRDASRPKSPPASSKTSLEGRRLPKNARMAPLGVLVGGGLLASLFAVAQATGVDEDKGATHLQSAPSSSPAATDDRDPSLPRFRLADIRAAHGAESSSPWVIYEDKVYDISDWIAAHPGGDVILRAAGGSIEPYWDIFSIHKTPYVREILAQYLIGYISPEDLVAGRPPATSIEDPFASDPERDARLITHTARPRNAEPPNSELTRTFLTPNGLFYVRNHMWVPVVEQEEKHVLTVELPDGEARRYTLGELKTRFPVHKVTVALQCSGNRRNDMTRHAGKTNGLQWGVGAISNADWEGVRLSDVLADAGLKVADAATTTVKNITSAANASDTADDANALHVQFTGLEAYGSSIPLPKALDPRGDVLLAFNMNGAPLPRDHGFPLRAVVPGHVAARSVKWLSKIVVSDEESTSQWQRRDYKSFGPNEGANPDWDRAPAIQEMPITSAITGVWVGECIRRGAVPWTRDAAVGVDMAAVQQKVGFTPKPPSSSPKEKDDPPCPSHTPAATPIAMEGYAYSGGGRSVSRVDVSLDGGATWDQASLLDDCADPSSPCHGNKAWAWRRWRYTGQLPVVPLPIASGETDITTTIFGNSNSKNKKKNCTTLVVKATDEAYNAQPETHRGIYNVRGNLATAWHRVRLCPQCTTATGKKGVTWSTGETYGCGFQKEMEEVREEMLRSASAASAATKTAAVAAAAAAGEK